MIDATKIVGTHDILMITFDTLRYDVAQKLWKEGKLLTLQKILPNDGWEKRHTTGSFTYAAHHAFFAGFFPTPVNNPKASRLFATRFAGSETAIETTFVFDYPTIIEGLKNEGYRTYCIGGVGFFNQQTPLSKVFPAMFDEAFWEQKFGVTEPKSAYYQFQKATDILQKKDQNTFLFINLSAIHQPNYFYLEKATEDSIESHGKALEYIDSQLNILLNSLKKNTLCLLMGDHGTAYGEDGYQGHRLAHEVVWNVPYAEIIIEK